MSSIAHLLIGVVVAALVLAGCGSEQSHDGHDHAAEGASARDDHAAEDGHGESRESPEDEHAGHDHADESAAEADSHLEDEEGSHMEEELGHVELTPDERKQLDLELATAGAGAIGMSAVFPGEVTANEDGMVHVVPTAGGIVREVPTSLGEYVEAGHVLAWIESSELAQAKLDFYAARAEVGCCQIELPRALEIFETTHKMLAILDEEPGVEELQQFDDSEMGAFRGPLVTAYAQYRAAAKAFERERALLAKSVASESEYIAAEAAFKTAQAAFTAEKGIARFQSLIQYTEAARKRQVAEFQAVSAEQRLRLLGVEAPVIERLVALVPQAAALEPCLCDDPDCSDGELPSILDVLGADERLGWYALRAPMNGYVTEKHLTLGESIDAETSVMSIVDTSSVWVRFSVYQKDLPYIRPGQSVSVRPGLGLPKAAGAIAYISPVIDPHSRTAQARLALANPEGVMSPGLYVQVHVEKGSFKAPVVIERDAVQLLDETDVVFVPEGEDFVAVPVELGPSDNEMVAVLSGLPPGRSYVRKGAFELKAKIVTSGLGSHAGHGH